MYDYLMANNVDVEADVEECCINCVCVGIALYIYYTREKSCKSL